MFRKETNITSTFLGTFSFVINVHTQIYIYNAVWRHISDTLYMIIYEQISVSQVMCLMTLKVWTCPLCQTRCLKIKLYNDLQSTLIFTRISYKYIFHIIDFDIYGTIGNVPGYGTWFTYIRLSLYCKSNKHDTNITHHIMYIIFFVYVKCFI